MRKILFIDRDGTICKEPHDEQVDRIDKIELLDGVIPALLSLKDDGYEFVMVTNQDGLGTESFPQEEFDIPHNFLMGLLASQGIKFKEVLISPHFAEANSECRKPRVGLVLKYLQDPSWSREDSAVIGDRESDIGLAENMGIKGIKIANESSGNALSWADIVASLTKNERQATEVRNTKETAITVSVNLDRQKPSDKIETGIGFLDHMLDQISRHSGIGLSVACKGDLEIDDHHTVEDIGLALGTCLKKALGQKIGIHRYGFLLPMDDVQAQIALDLGGRPFFRFEGEFKRPMIGELASEMIPHFFRSLSESLGANLHMKIDSGNEHHMAEALFKGFARTLKQAISSDGSTQLPSTKGVL